MNCYYWPILLWRFDIFFRSPKAITSDVHQWLLIQFSTITFFFFFTAEDYNFLTFHKPSCSFFSKNLNCKDYSWSNLIHSILRKSFLFTISAFKWRQAFHARMPHTLQNTSSQGKAGMKSFLTGLAINNFPSVSVTSLSSFSVS